MKTFFRRQSRTQTWAADSTSYDDFRTGFTAAVSHELRTPLARVLVLLESALLPGADIPTLLHRAKEEVEHASELIDEVLFLGALERGEVAPSGATRVADVAAAVFSALRDRAERAGVELRADIDAYATVPLRHRLTRVMIENLTENAIRHSGAGSVFTLGARSSSDSVVLTATDTGRGVGRRELPRLFERFYRGDRGRAAEGTGLGLAVVKHIVTGAGGRIDAEDRPGGGLVIRCTFTARR